MTSTLLSIPRSLFILLLFAILHVRANPATLTFKDCFSGNVSQKFNISTVYAQILDTTQMGVYLNLTVLGVSPQQILGFTNTSTSLATLFTTTSVLTLNAWINSSYLCSPLRPPSPLPALDNTTSTYCPIPAGPFAFSSSIPWGPHRALTTLNTRLRAVDPFSSELLCLDVSTTPLDPRPDVPYGKAVVILYATIALAIAYWVVVGVARIVSAWGRGITRPNKGLWSKAQSAGFILASAISGERLATSPALMRFCTPSMRDVIFHTQWCAVLAMVAVQWPPFVYPILVQTAWSTLSYNVTLTEGSGARFHHWDPLSVAPYNPPSNFAGQLADPNSPLYINSTVPNILFTLPTNATSGISSFAYTVGVRPQDLFGICLTLFLAIIGVTIFVSFLVWLIDYIACLVVGGGGSTHQRPNSVNQFSGTRSPGFVNKDIENTTVGHTAENEGKSSNGRDATASIFRPSSRFALPLGGSGHFSHRKSWWRIRSDINSFHGSVLHGNLVRIFVLFHLPVTIFSCYQMTLPHTHASRSSIALAGMSFTVLSILIPALLVLRVTLTTTNKLYDETRTLLSFGPLYNHYRHGSQMFASLLFATNLAFGVTIGCGQGSGTAQAIIILVVEVISALVTSIWLPWGRGASMGLISFLFCVARIVVAVLLVILTPAISIGPGAGGWVAYGILIILALVYFALLLMLVVKLIEAAVRILGGIGFERSTYVVDGGLLGACGLLGCCSSRQRSRHRSRRHRYKATEVTQREHRDSSHFSSHTPPKILGRSNSKKGSTNSAPPSVLKPEHALRPYREESDDESGFIMGAWQPFARPGYAPANNLPPSPTSPVAPRAPAMSSGFSRVGGGRAHIDAPYAITAGSSQTFPSMGHQNQSADKIGSSAPVIFDDDESPPPSLSHVSQHQEMGLPAGAGHPPHVRTQSQTAIIEDTSAFLVPHLPSPSSPSSQPGTSSRPGTASRPGSRDSRLQGLGGGLLQPPVMSSSAVADDDDDSDVSQPKKKPWYHLRRNKPYHSEGSPAVSAPANEEAELEAPAGQPGRSFVVIRKPQGSPARSHQFSSGSGSPNADASNATPTPTRGSFVLVSGSGDARAANATT